MPAPDTAFETAIAPLIPRARALAARMLRDRSLAEDASQEALLRAQRFWESRRDEAAWPWLRRIVIRECLRLAGRRPPAAGGEAVEAVDLTDLNPEERVILAEERREVRRAVDRLPKGYRTVLQLRHALGLPETEVAAVLGLPLGTVKWRSARARDHLRQVLTRGYAPPLADTLREVALRLVIRVGLGPREIRVTVGGGALPLPSPISEEWTTASTPCAPEVLAAAFPRLHLPDSVLAAHPDLRPHLLTAVGGGREEAFPVGAEVDTPENPPRLLIAYGPHRPDPEGRPSTRATHAFPDNRTLELDVDTRVGPHPARWARIDGRHHLWWHTADGDAYHVAGTGAAAEVRQVAEAIAGQG